MNIGKRLWHIKSIMEKYNNEIDPMEKHIR